MGQKLGRRCCKTQKREKGREKRSDSGKEGLQREASRGRGKKQEAWSGAGNFFRREKVYLRRKALRQVGGINKGGEQRKVNTSGSLRNPRRQEVPIRIMGGRTEKNSCKV